MHCDALQLIHNTLGAHPSGLIGEDPSHPPESLMPLLCRVALGKVPFVNVFGSDYPTRDGSGCRDFIHVMDVASAHVLALSKLYASDFGSAPFSVFNLGSETGYTVLEMIHTLEKVSGTGVPYKVK